MIDSFPYESWDQVSQEPFKGTFWTFGPANGADGGSLTGTYILTALGILLMVAAVTYYIWLERKRLQEQAEFLRGATPGS
jgi:hypothetical protein